MSISDEWVRYLRAEGYLGSYSDMLREALKTETGSTRKNIDDLWFEYLRGEGYTGGLTSMFSQWLDSKGYVGSLDDKLLQALENDDIFGGVTPPADPISILGDKLAAWYTSGPVLIGPPPPCAVTLTHDGLDAFGLAPMSVSDQTVSVTADGVGRYGMTTGVAGKPVDWSGVRVVAKNPR